jgi:hypothetical protein
MVMLVGGMFAGTMPQNRNSGTFEERPIQSMIAASTAALAAGAAGAMASRDRINASQSPVLSGRASATRSSAARHEAGVSPKCAIGAASPRPVTSSY